MSEARQHRVAPMIPPAFWREEGEDFEEANARLVREEWRKVCANLEEPEGSGRVPFRNVRELRARIEELHEEHQEVMRKRDRARGWLRFYDVLIFLCEDRMRETDVGLDDLVQEAAPQRFHEHRADFEKWEAEGALPRPAGEMHLSGIQGPGEPWAWSWKDGEATLSVGVPDALLKRRGIDLDALPPLRRERFNGAQTWRRALEQIQEKAQVPRQWQEEHEQKRAALRFRWGVRKNVLHQYETFGELPPPPGQKAPIIITGYNAPDYAREARKVLRAHKQVSDFGQLAAKMGPGGESKTDSLKRSNATGYDDLPREVKDSEGFQRFKEMLFAARIT